MGIIIGSTLVVFLVCGAFAVVGALTVKRAKETALKVAGWRFLRTLSAEGQSRVEHARAKEGRWELEVAMIGDFGLTLLPETEPLSKVSRDDHLGWRSETLKQARRERLRTERLRRVPTLGLWWR